MNKKILAETPYYRRKNRNEKIIKVVFLIATLVTLVSLGLIILSIVIKGVQPFITGDTTFWQFITGTVWDPEQDIYGIGYMIVGTILGMLGAIIIAMPIGIFAAVATAEILPNRYARIAKNSLELLAGIPSVLFGLFGLVVIVPWIASFSPDPQGQSLLAVILVLAIMILPTIIAMSDSAIRSLPKSYREASFGLGANRIQTTFKVLIPAAKSGIIASMILGIGRAIGETMAVILVAGNPSQGLPTSVFSEVRPMTANIALEMSYAQGYHQSMLFATALVLLLFILLVNFSINMISRKGGK